MFATRTPSLSDLMQMLSTRRPAGSKSERRWIKAFIEPLGVTRDAFGNLSKSIGTAPVLWSCHTDTVHREGGVQRLTTSPNGLVMLATGELTSNCLGADCTAGAWLMREMILANVPGLYVFHREEEIGGLGSNYIATHTPEFLDGIKAAIAFDRRGLTSVITHQGGRCCSDIFGQSLADALGMGYKLDDTGLFTDTANYTDLVGECTNISVGYFSEHRIAECVDTVHLFKLLAKLLTLDTDALVYSREPGEVEVSTFGNYGWKDDDAELTHFGRKYHKAGRNFGSSDDDAWLYTSKTLLQIIKDHPEEIADWLEQQGINPDDLMMEVDARCS